MYFDARKRVVLVLLEAEEGVPLGRIETPCGVVVSPTAPAEVIVYQRDTNLKIVFEAAYGSLPDGTVVVGVKDASGAFPEEGVELKVRVLLDPYQGGCDDVDVLSMSLIAWGGGCPICGKLTDEDLDAFDDDAPDDDSPDDDGDGDWTPDGGDDEPGVEIPMPGRFTLKMLEPSLN